jgi:RND family efflux transporter MFP subunit
MRVSGLLRLLLPVLFVQLGTALAADKALPFDTATVGYETVPEERVFDAVVEAVQQSTVSAQTSGRIVQLNFDVDDFVNKGDVILRFTDIEQRARLEAAQANLDEAKARLAQAQEDYERTKNIYAKKLVAKATMDKATAELKAAKARLEAGQAGVQAAQEQLDHTVVKAPYSGIVVKRHVEIGETANVGQPLMTGLSLEHLRATVALPQSYVSKVRAHGKASVVLPTDGKRLEIDQLTVFPYADPMTHDFKVRINLPANIPGVYPGMLIKIGFLTGEHKRLLAPTNSVVYRGEVTGIYVVDPDGQVGFRQVRVGRIYDGNRIEVLAGLQDGDRIALDPINAGVYLKKQRAGKES